MLQNRVIKRFVEASVLYGGIVVVLTWPSILNIQHSIMGDGGAYQFLWGLWWFGEALKSPFHSLWNCPIMLHPFGANLIQHDYPLWPNFFAWTTQKLGLTLIGSYNASFLLAFWLNACCAFLLAQNVVEDFLPSFAAGLAFAFAPYFYSRSVYGHFGLMHAYSLPLTALCLTKARQPNSAVWSVGAGCCLVLAVLCQYYYAVYAASYIVLFTLYHTYGIRLSVSKRLRYSSFGITFFMVLGAVALLSAVFLSIFIAYKGGGVYNVMGREIGLHDTVNPTMAWWLSWEAAFLLRFKLGLKIMRKKEVVWRSLFFQWTWIALPLVALTPFFVQAGRLIMAGDFGAQDLGWKTGPSGAFPISIFFPNVFNTFWGAARHGKLASWSLLEHGSIGLGWTALLVVFLTKPWKGSRWWTFIFLFSLVMSFGPFLKIVPGLENGPALPFWLFRYIPIVSGARMPMRWIALAWVGWSVLIARAIQVLRSRLWRAACLLGVLIESVTIPFNLYSTAVPVVYSLVAQDKRPGVVLELPFNVSDGRKQWGEGGDADQLLYYQTLHHHPIVGGSLGRVPERIFTEYQKQPLIHQVVLWQHGLSTGSEADKDLFMKWIRDWKISWVVLDKERAKGVLGAMTRSHLGQPTYEDDHFVAWRII